MEAGDLLLLFRVGARWAVRLILLEQNQSNIADLLRMGQVHVVLLQINPFEVSVKIIFVRDLGF